MEFKVPALPSGSSSGGGGSKRKDAPLANGSSSSLDPSAKRARPTYNVSDPLAGVSRQAGPSRGKQTAGPSVQSKLPLNGAAATVDDVADEDMPGSSSSRFQEDEAVGETFEADDGDEEGGRFFGGGTNTTQEQILDMFAGVDDENSGPALPTVQELRRQIRDFQKVVNKNLDLRSKFPDDPSKFMESEADLDRAFTFLMPLTQNPLAYYPELTSSETLLPTLTNLLTHENTDIALQAVSVLYELTDEEVGEDLVEEEEDQDKRDELARHVRMVVDDFLQALLDHSLLDLLVPNLARLDEAKDEADRTGVFNIIGIFENLLGFMPPLAVQIVKQTDLLPWLLKRIAVKAYDSNKQYASELISILTQEEREVRLKVAELGGMDTLLQVLSQYRKHDPEDTEELEFMENVFDALCSILAEPEIKASFLEAEGNELMVLIMKEKGLARSRSVKVLDFALQTEEGADNCVRFVESMGLKSLFNVFMGKGAKKSKLETSTSTFEDEEHVLSVVSSLFSNLASDTAPRIRLLAKFVENNYEKIDRLIEMRETAESRMVSVNKEIDRERKAMEANGEEITEIELDDWYLRRINAGLAHLQNADYCLAWIAMEDDGAAQHAKMLLSRKGKGFMDIVATLKEMRSMISADSLEDIETAKEDGVTEALKDDPATREKVIILSQLAQFCEAL